MQTGGFCRWGQNPWDTHWLGHCWEGESSPVSPKPAGSCVCMTNMEFTDKPRRPEAYKQTNGNKMQATDATWNSGQVHLATVPFLRVWWILTSGPSSRNSIQPVPRNPRFFPVGIPPPPQRHPLSSLLRAAGVSMLVFIVSMNGITGYTLYFFFDLLAMV